MHDIVEWAWESENVEQLHAHDCHHNVSTTSCHKVWHQKYAHMHNTRTVIQDSSLAGMSHTAYVCCMLHTDPAYNVHWNGR